MSCAPLCTCNGLCNAFTLVNSLIYTCMHPMYEVHCTTLVSHPHTPRRTLCELFSFRPFADQLPPGSDSLKGTLEKCISVAVPSWFLVVDAQLLPQVNVCHSALMHTCDLGSLACTLLYMYIMKVQ